MSQRPALRSVLIANRGEIACRIIRTCRRLGIRSIAIYSDADANAQHVQLADVAYRLGPAPAAESYLDMDKIIAVARRAEAQAVHPGYGFLSENTDFARRLAEAGITFVGPSIEAIEKMGSKADAKRVMEQAGVPTVPGYHGVDQDLETLTEQAQQIGYPLLIKAAAGGGGKGMRIVRTADEFTAALQSARRESKAAFGDDRMIMERYLEQPRHIEVQVFGDTQGNIVHLFERDCSTQRRYQKVLEETPSPFLTDAQRAPMFAAAVDAARAVNYVGAGTVEFIVEPDGAFYFMEMNTRLQVEHPVTELVTGVDLVEWQLRVAAGEPLPLAQTRIHTCGHAIEARLYAEDPQRNFLPGSGTLERLRFPPSDAHTRIDSGVVEGDEVTIHYDPMIAKVIGYGADRTEALDALRRALAETRIIGPANNAAFLESLVQDERFIKAEIHTAMLDQGLEDFLPESKPAHFAVAAAACWVLLEQEAIALGAQRRTADAHSPWGIADGWRVAHRGRRVLHFEVGDSAIDIDAWGASGHYRLRFPGFDGEWFAEQNDDGLILLRENERQLVGVLGTGEHVLVHDGTSRVLFTVSNPYEFSPTEAAAGDVLVAPMPGNIISVQVEAGASVKEGEALVVMEAMKMELTLRAPRDGEVERVDAAPGAFVEADTLLIQLAPNDD